MVLITVLSLLGFVSAAGLAAYFLETHTAEKYKRKFCPANIILPCLLCAAVSVRYLETPLTIAKGIIFILILYYATLQDICRKEVDDCVPVLIAITSLIQFDTYRLLYMLFSGIVTAFPLFMAALIKPGKVGGADIKLMAAAGLLLGLEKGLAALIIGLFLGVTCTFIIRKTKKTNMAKAFPLVPYLSTGCVLAYLF